MREGAAVPATKIATCCYCGTRAALVLTGREHHELACRSCGAPLHQMKRLRAAPESRPAETFRRPSRGRPGAHDGKEMPSKRKRGKRKPFGRKLVSELWDIIEDIID